MSLQQLDSARPNALWRKNSNRLTLRPCKPKIHQNVPCFRPGKKFFILTLCTLRQWLEWPLVSVLTSQPMHKTCSGPSKKNFCRRFTTKLLIAEILERHLLVAKKVPYNSQMTLHENCWPFMPQMDDLCFGPPMATYSNGHSSENGQHGIFSNFRWTESDRLAPSCKFLGQNSEYPALQNFKKSTLNDLRNGQSVTYSKMQTKVCRGKIDFLRPLYFGISTRTALELSKIDMCQIWPERVLGHVISCPEPKFEKRIPMGSVPNER